MNEKAVGFQIIAENRVVYPERNRFSVSAQVSDTPSMIITPFKLD